MEIKNLYKQLFWIRPEIVSMVRNIGLTTTLTNDE